MNKKRYIVLTFIILILLTVKLTWHEEKGIIIGEDCHELARQIIPETMTLSISNAITPEAYRITDRWKDGKLISETTPNFDSIYFIDGSEEGHNPNYYYFMVLLGEDSKTNPEDVYLKYENNVTDENGKIIGKNQFYIRPILKRVGSNKFKIMKYNFADFNPETYTGQGCIWNNI
ncbi:MAG: hypothetical protein U9Q69_03735 [Nanoarchaeota archaeon]|nr:hypothetical protein [Nanoarchaeota archaeon]